MASKANDAKDKARLNKKFARLYAAAVDVQTLATEITGQEIEVVLNLQGDTFTASAGNLKFGAKSSGL